MASWTELRDNKLKAKTDVFNAVTVFIFSATCLGLAAGIDALVRW